MSDPVADLMRAMANAWDEGHEQGYDSGLYADREDDEPETREGRSQAENPYRAALAKHTGEPEPTPDSRKKQNEGEGAPNAANAQSTPAGEGLPPLCRVCGGRIAAHPELFAWEHIREPSWNHRAELLELP